MTGHVYDLLPYPIFIERATAYLLPGQVHFTETELNEVNINLNIGTSDSRIYACDMITSRYGNIPWEVIE